MAKLPNDLIFYSLLKLVKKVGKQLKPLLPKSVLDFYAEYRRDFPLIDQSKIVLFAPSSVLPQYAPRVDIDRYVDQTARVKVSLITTVLNEGENARVWLESLLDQSRLPDEIVICDGGSTDETIEIIEEFAGITPVKVQLIKSRGMNIAQGRNTAIQAAMYPIVACTDFGCVLDQDWLWNLVLPFEIDPSLDLSSGYYEINQKTTLDHLSSHFFGVDLNAVDPQSFLPSSRSLALKKTFWAKSGRYPEWLTDAGEDTLFDFQAKSQNAKWAFAPQAKVFWKAPKTLKNLFKTFYRYAVGDGEAGTLSEHYWYKSIEVVRSILGYGIVLVSLVLLLIFLGSWGLMVDLAIFLVFTYIFVQKNRKICTDLEINFYPYTLIYEIVGSLQMIGFAKGVLNRSKVRDRQVEYYRGQLRRILDQSMDRNGVIIYPATHDWGFMFQRPHQMARSFAWKGYLYFFCTNNERTDAVFGFQEVEPNLYLCHVPQETFQILQEPVVYVGSAWHRSTLDSFDRPIIIYDHYDDLEVSGAMPEDHNHLIEDAKILLVTSQALLEKVSEKRSDVLFVPNGVDYDWIRQNRPDPFDELPEDWKPVATKGNPIIGYSGALAEWFDYDLLSFLAENMSTLEFALVGVDYDESLHRSGVLKYDNVHWLGMKSYDDLFKYVWRFDVGVIPFKINQITSATSPIKLFEYLACGLPVVTTALPECRKHQIALVADTYDQFADYLEVALSQKQDECYLSLANEIAQENTWEFRVSEILELLNQPDRLAHKDNNLVRKP